MSRSGQPRPPGRDEVAAALDAAAREEGGRVLALLARRFGDLDLAQDAVATALENAARTWPRDGVPGNPAGWLLVSARRAAIDRLRHEASQARRAVGAASDPTIAVGRAAWQAADATGSGAGWEGIDDTPDARLISGGVSVPDERLRLVLLCAHPALHTDAQVALTLRLVLGLTTAEIAAAFLVPEATLAQRIVRAKHKIKAAGIPLSMPGDLSQRLDAVLSVIYLVFTEGHFSAAGGALTRVDLAAEALRLSEVVDGLAPDRPEVQGLQALLLFHHARRDTRVDAAGDLVLLADQDRARWHRDEIERGNSLLGRAMAAAPPSRYVLMAVIAGLHANATSLAETDWESVVLAYDHLLLMDPSPVVALNRAVALASTQGAEEALRSLAAIDGLAGYHAWHVARADLLRRTGRVEESRQAAARAADLAVNETQRRYLRQGFPT